MSEHFENLWEKSEILAESVFDNKNYTNLDIISELQENLTFLRLSIKNNDTINQSDIIGNILFNLTFLSKKLNINTYLVLKEHLDDVIIDTLDPDIDNSNI